jgi:hypothetical protein
MQTQTATLEQEKLLQLAEEYRDRGYEILLHPSPVGAVREPPVRGTDREVAVARESKL